MPQGRCRICGCTEDNACVSGELGSCWWINDDQDICSHCFNYLDDTSIERPIPRSLTKSELSEASDNGTKLVLRPQFNHHRNGWMVVMYTGKGWSNRFSSNVFDSKELAYKYAREFALNSTWYITVD